MTTNLKALDLDGRTVTVKATFIDADGIERAKISRSGKIEVVPAAWLTWLSR